MGFILHFYIIFGTNLLTGGPARIAGFFAYFSISKKGISKGVQTEWNLRERDFLKKRNPGDLKWPSRNKGGRHEAGGAPTPLGAPSYLMATSFLPWRPLQVSLIAFVPKITLLKVSFRLDSVWYSFSMKHRNRQKTTIWPGPPVSRLVQKMI